MDLSSFNAQSARDMSLIAMVVGVLGVLLVLKFVSSVVSKLLLTAVFAGIIWLGFTQRDALSACIAEIQTRVSKSFYQLHQKSMVVILIKQIMY
jgi:hypothetical protein